MDEGNTYVNVKFGETGPQSPSNEDPTSTYSELNFPKDEPLIVEDEDPAIASVRGEQPITAQTEQTCYKDWVRNEDRCYFISTFETSYRGATKQCSNYTSRLLQLNTTEKKIRQIQQIQQYPCKFSPYSFNLLSIFPLRKNGIRK
ncbi:C-type lectin domain family 4 member A-like [Hypanus sabinus]|uniref:C-type lectin domain family 4 member A-like n=1 Tax=Hypanus sabinus TaxID=79690 RepID=UPI0028C3DF8A|nr:C-type lectin domain family 4 member A-like [Hypanus sabinus]